MSVAKIGDTIRFHGDNIGKVEQVRESSVIVRVVENRTNDVYPMNVTVVNHKNYTVEK